MRCRARRRRWARTAPGAHRGRRPSSSATRARLPPRPVEQGRPAPFAERARRAALLAVAALLCGGRRGGVPLARLRRPAPPGLAAAQRLAGGPARPANGAAARPQVVRRRAAAARAPRGTCCARCPGTCCWCCGAPASASPRRCSATRSSAGETVTLFVCGAVFAAALWTGPGGSRVRSPAVAGGEPGWRRWKPWLAVDVRAACVARHRRSAGSPRPRGASWAPATDRPLSGPTVGQPRRSWTAWNAWRLLPRCQPASRDHHSASASTRRRADLSYPERFFRFRTRSNPTERDPMDLHGAFHVYDTTLRDGAQQEGLNLSVADKLTIARQLDGLGVGYIEGGWPGANPKDTEFFRRASRRARPQAREARGLRLDPAGRRTGRRRPAGRRPARQRRLAWSPWSRSRTTGTSTWRCGPRSRRTSRWSATPSPTCAPRASRSSSTPSTSSTATAPTATTRSRCCGRRTTPAPRWSRSATPTAACCPTGSPTSSTTSSTPPASGSASTPTTTAAARSRTRWPPSTPAPRHVQGCINGYGERTGNADLVSVVANLELKLDRPVLPPGLLQRGDPDRARGRRGHQRAAGLAAAVRRRLGVRAQGRAARQRDQGRPGPLPAHRPRATSATTCGCWSPTWPAAPRSSSRAASSASTSAPTRSCSPGSPSGSRSWRRPGYTFEAADASFELLLVEEVEGRRPSYFEVESWRVITETLDHREAGDEAVSEATVKLQGRRASGTSSPARATARSTRSTRRCARRSARRSPRS